MHAAHVLAAASFSYVASYSYAAIAKNQQQLCMLIMMI
jgi:hypothetical protein